MAHKVKREFIDVDEIFDELMGDVDFSAPQGTGKHSLVPLIP